MTGVGGGGVTRLKIIKPGPVVIFLVAQRTLSQFYGVYGVIALCFKLFNFFYEILRLSAVRLENRDGIRIKMASEISKKHATSGAKAITSQKHPVPILKAQNYKKNLC